MSIHRELLNLNKFESCFNASLDEAMANFSADLLDSPVNTRQLRAVLKTLLTAFQREIKATYENYPDLSQQDQRHHSFHSEFLLLPYHTTSSRKFRALKMRGGEFFSHSAFSLFIIIFSLKERRIWASTARLRRTKFIFRNPISISFPMLHAHSRRETDPYVHAAASGYERKGESQWRRQHCQQKFYFEEKETKKSKIPVHTGMSTLQKHAI